MLRTLEELHDCAIGAADGVIGHVKDLYLDDQDDPVARPRLCFTFTPERLTDHRLARRAPPTGRSAGAHRPLGVTARGARVRR